jgi:ABC-2 type transport system permease protein
VGRELAAALAQLPAIWVMVGITLAIYGLAPRHLALGWISLAGFVVLAEVGPLVNLDQWIMDLSPFAHVPKLPGTAFTVWPEAALITIAAMLGGAGLIAFRHRDID